MSSMINSLDKAPEGALSSLRSVFSNRLPTLGILLVCILLSVPVLTILASVTNNSDGVWQHLY